MTRGRPATPLGTYGTIQTKQLPNGTWEARARARLLNGTITDRRARGKSKTAATNKLKAKLNNPTTNTNTPGLTNTTPLTTACTYWLNHHTDLRPQSRKTYERVLDKYITPGIGQIRLNELTTGRLDQFISTLTPGNAETVYKVLNQTLNNCQRLDIIPHNPATAVKKPKRTTQPVRALTPEEMQLIRARIKKEGSQRLKDITDLCIYAGLRLGEALALQWEQINLDSNPPTMKIAATLVESTGKLQDAPKTESSRRTIALPPRVVEILTRRYNESYREYTPLVFPSNALTPIREANFNREFRAVKGEEFAWVKMHTFRKTIASMLTNAGQAQAAAELLGHSSTNMTERRYVQRGVSRLPDDITAVLDESGQG